MAVQIEHYEVDYVNDKNMVFLRVTDTVNPDKPAKLVAGYKGKLLEGTMDKDLSPDELKRVNQYLISFNRCQQ